MEQRIKFIIPVIDKPYYLWQMLVQIKSFRDLGYEQDAIYPVSYWNQPSDILSKLLNSNQIKAEIIPYNDERSIKNYSASLKPWLMHKYFASNPSAVRHIFVYLDSDVLFTRPFDFTPFKGIAHKFYGSNTKGYTGVQYIKEKGEMLFYELCQIAEVDPVILEQNSDWEVGAQYIFQGADQYFWKEIYEKSSKMYEYMVTTKDKYHPKEHQYPIQAWVAEMMHTQWLAMKMGFEPQVTPLMDFAWSNWKIEDWEKFPFWHNAGQTVEDGIHFCKITHQISPFKKEIKVSPQSISSKYLEVIKSTENEFPDLIW